MKVDTRLLDGKKDGQIELPNIFETDVKKDVIRKAYISLESHGFQKHSTKQTAWWRFITSSDNFTCNFVNFSRICYDFLFL